MPADYASSFFAEPQCSIAMLLIGYPHHYMGLPTATTMLSGVSRTFDGGYSGGETTFRG